MRNEAGKGSAKEGIKSTELEISITDCEIKDSTRKIGTVHKEQRGRDKAEI